MPLPLATLFECVESEGALWQTQTLLWRRFRANTLRKLSAALRPDSPKKRIHRRFGIVTEECKFQYPNLSLDNLSIHSGCVKCADDDSSSEFR